MAYFREVQRFRQWWLWAAMLVPVGVIAYVHPKPAGALLIPLAVFGLVCMWMYAARLETEVRDDELVVRFYLLWPRKIIPLKDIVSCEARSYSPIWEYGGWGVRYGKSGRAFNVSGDRGVQLVLTGGQRLLIGSQQAEALAAAILTRMSLVKR